MPVIPGIVSFLADPPWKNKRLGLVTNPSGLMPDGRPAWKACLDQGFRLQALFGPEHGFRGAAQDAVHVADEPFHGIPTYSLYGTRLRPEPSMLRDLDALVYDIQDVGCRYYTYLYTLAYVIEAATAAGVPVVVLDRPNPLGGLAVEGGPIKDHQASFVGGYGLAHRYGMTIGEFALYCRGEYHPEASVEVARLGGWVRSMTYADTGLPFVSPSPNLPTEAAALVYPGTCLIEGTNLSEGRGTTRPFETLGAPWIDGEALREELAGLGLPGVVFSSSFFTPTFSKHRDLACQGVTLHVTDRQGFRPLQTGVALLHTIKRLYPEHLEWRAAWEEPGIFFLDRLSGDPRLRLGLDRGESIDTLYYLLTEGRQEFMNKRARYLLYP